MVKYVTKNRPRFFLLCFFIVILSSSFYGCGGTFRSFPGEGDIGGSWNLFLTPSSGSALAPKVMTLAQTDNNVSGTTSDGATLTGAVNGNNITLTLTNADATTTTLTGTVGDNWKTMSGTYTSTGSAGSGNWTAMKNVPTPTPTPTPTQIAVLPTSATLHCNTQDSQIFTVTGGTPANYSASASSAFVTLSAFTTGTTSRQFTVTAKACVSETNPADGTVIDLTVTDNIITPVTVKVTISNP